MLPSTRFSPGPAFTLKGGQTFWSHQRRYFDLPSLLFVCAQNDSPPLPAWPLLGTEPHLLIPCNKQPTGLPANARYLLGVMLPSGVDLSSVVPHAYHGEHPFIFALCEMCRQTSMECHGSALSTRWIAWGLTSSTLSR